MNSVRLINVNAATKNQKHWIDERARMGAPAHIWRINEFEILFRVFNHKFIFEFSRILFSFAVAKDLYENDSEILRNIVCVCGSISSFYFDSSKSENLQPKIYE